MENDILKDLETIKKQLLKNKVIVFPTDTVYGLLANGYSEQAMNNVFSIKQRPKEKTFAIFIDKKRIGKYVELSDRNRALLEKYTPGPVTFILKNKDKKLTHLEIDGKIAIRIPENKFLQQLLKILKFPLIATSANISNEKTPIVYQSIDERIKNHDLVNNINYEYLLDKEPSGISSSIFDISENKIKVLREGLIKLYDII